MTELFSTGTDDMSSHSGTKSVMDNRSPSMTQNQKISKQFRYLRRSGPANQGRNSISKTTTRTT